MKTSKHRLTAGFTLVEIMIVVAIIGMLAAIAIPNFIRSRITSQQNACIHNLREIDGAIQEWALENHQAPDSAVDPSGIEIQPYMGRGTSGSLGSCFCPADATLPAPSFTSSYSVTTVSDPPTCKILGTAGHILN